MPEISVIVPVYNTEKYLDRCIKSILNQTYTDFELILVDDGSTDSSGLICDDYKKKDKRIRVIHQENKGVSSARNEGIEKTKGKYIAFVDSDDYVESNYLNVLYKNIIKNKSDLTMCNYYSFNKENNIYICDHDFDNNEIVDKELLFKKIIDSNNTKGYFSPVNKMYIKSIITSNDLYFDETMSFGEDMCFVINYLKYCDNVSFSDKVLYYYELSSNGLFSKYRKSLIDDMMKCYEEIVRITKPDNYTDRDLIPLSLKYYMYINRYIKGVVDNEDNKLEIVNDIFNNETVKKIFSIISMLDSNDLDKYNLVKYEFRIPKLVTNNHIRLASYYALYQNDENCLLRRIRRII